MARRNRNQGQGNQNQAARAAARGVAQAMARRQAGQANRQGKRPRGGQQQAGIIEVTQRAVPNAMPASVMPQAPRLITRNGKTIVVGHENFATVSGSVAFGATRYQVNPGLASLFAWLSGRASGYEKYRLHKLEVAYVPAEAVVTTAGVVYLAFDYDPDDAAPTTLASLSTYEGLKSSHTYEVNRCVLDMSRVQRDLLKVRTGPKAGSRLLYDPCSIIFATVSMGGATAIGQLWIGYELELLAPQLEPATLVPSSLSAYNESTNQGLATTVEEPVLWSETLTNGLELSKTTGVFTMPAGIFKISGVVCFNDTSAEVVDYKVNVYKNGAAMTPGSITSMELTGLANGQVTVPFIAVVSFTASETMQIQVTATGAAGTLTLVADKCKLLVEAL